MLALSGGWNGSTLGGGLLSFELSLLVVGVSVLVFEALGLVFEPLIRAFRSFRA